MQTVAELIEHLKTLPQGAIVATYDEDDELAYAGASAVTLDKALSISGQRYDVGTTIVIVS